MSSSEILTFLGSGILISILLFFLIDFIGSWLAGVCLNKEEVNTSFFGIYFGFVFVLFGTASLTVGVFNSFLPPFLFILVLAVFALKRGVGWKSLNWKFGWFETMFLVLNPLIRWVTNYDHKNNCFYYDLIDSYSYADQVFFFEKYRLEATFPQMESVSLGMPFLHSNYHYSEYYVSLFFKYFLSYSNYQTLFFFAMPFLISLLQIAVFRYFRKKGFRTDLLVFLAVFTISSLFKFFDFSLVTNLFVQWSNQFRGYFYFPVYQVIDPFSTYIYSYYGKATSFLFMVFLVLASYRIRNNGMLFFMFLFAFVFNVIFFPFLILLFFFLNLSNELELPRNLFWRRMSLPFFAFFTAFAYFMCFNIGLDLGKSHMVLPLYDVGFSPVALYKSISAKIFFISSNFFPLLFFAAVGYAFQKRSWLSFGILGYILLFPVSFLWFNVLFKLYSVLGIVLFFYLFVFVPITNETRRVVFSVVLINLCLWIFDIYLGFAVDFFQFHQMTLVGSLYLVCFLVFFRSFRPSIGWAILLLVFSVQNLSAINFFYHRVFYQENSSMPFVNRFLARSKGRMVRAVYISDRTNIPYIGYGKAGHDIKNVSDSLIQYFISPDVLNKKDTNEIKRTFGWSLYQNHPFNKFVKKQEPGLRMDEIKRNFISQFNIGHIIRVDAVKRSNMNFANELLIDSMHNDQQYYWIYFLNTGKK